MRVYFEKPRTGLGWKGFLYDPDLDGSDDLVRGLARCRALLVQIAELNVPIATEILDPLVAEYFADCLTWVAIGARTSESQIHRQIASDLPCPVGFKNATCGDVAPALHSVRSARASHTFLGIDSYGAVSVRRSRGNEGAHLVLRGGKSGPNHSMVHVAEAAKLATEQGTSPSLIVDCSHDNSGKDCRKQAEVAREVSHQMKQVGSPVVGLMIESHLEEGRQDLAGPLRYGVSVTDPCLGLDETTELLRELAFGFES
jgi:3-deoxy-7-phosphoheptulonate synthase